jgi:hypothetical protein
VKENINNNTSVEIEQVDNMIEMEGDEEIVIKNEEENLENIVQQINEEETENIIEEDIKEVEKIEEDISSMNSEINSEKVIETEEEKVIEVETTGIEEEDKKLKNEENAFIISGYKNGVTVFLESSDIENNDAQWTKNLLSAKIYLEEDLEQLLFLLKELYFKTEEIANIDIRKFHWEKHNSLNKYFSDLENKLELIKSKMTEEEYKFLLKYKDKL